MYIQKRLKFSLFGGRRTHLLNSSFSTNLSVEQKSRIEKQKELLVEQIKLVDE